MIKLCKWFYLVIVIEDHQYFVIVIEPSQLWKTEIVFSVDVCKHISAVIVTDKKQVPNKNASLLLAWCKLAPGVRQAGIIKISLQINNCWHVHCCASMAPFPTSICKPVLLVSIHSSKTHEKQRLPYISRLAVIETFCLFHVVCIIAAHNFKTNSDIKFTRTNLMLKMTSVNLIVKII